MKAAVVQFAAGYDHEANLKKAYSMAAAAKKRGASLLSFSEFFSHRWFVKSPVRDLAFKDDACEWGIEMATSLTIYAVISYYEVLKGKAFNTSVLIDPKGKVIGKYRKNHLPELPHFHEKAWYQGGDLGLPVFCTDIGKIGIMICSDAMFTECARILSQKGAQILIIPRATVKKARSRWNSMLIANCIISGCYILSSNRSDSCDDLEFDGHSMIIEPGGNITGEAAKTDEIIVKECDLKKVALAKTAYPCNVKAMLDMYYRGKKL